MKTGDRIQQLRRLHGLSLETLARRAGMTKGYLSKVERSKTPPPFSTLEKLAQVFDVDVRDILPAAAASSGSSNIDFIPGRARDRGALSSRGICAFQPFLKTYRNKQMSPFLMTVGKGRTERFCHDAEEFVFVVEGRILLEYEGRRLAFGKGEGFYLDSRLPHAFRNEDETPAVLLAVDYNYRRF